MLVLFSFSCLLKFASSLQRSAYSQSHRLVLQKTANSLSLAPLRRSYVLHTTALASARNSVGTAALFSRNFTTGKRSRRGFDTKMIEKGTATDSATTIGTGTISETSDAPFVVKERKDGSYMVKCHEDEYERLFDEKLASLTGLLGWHGEVDKFASEKSHFRMRANFNVWHDNRKEQTPSGAFYAMFDEVDKRQVCEIKSFPRGSKRINELMDGLMEVFRQSNLMFQTVFEVRFLTTLSCESLIVLLYRRPIPDEWLAEAEKAAAQLMCKIVGRSRNKKVEAGGEDIVRETLHVKGRDYHYFQTEGNRTYSALLDCS